MVLVSSAHKIKKAFIEWNGWGPPTSEFQINEYCWYEVEPDADREFIRQVLTEWMNSSPSI